MAGIGRAPYPPHKLRSFKTLVALTPGEAAAIRSAAGSKPIAVWIRDVALRAARRRRAKR